jgi:predicted ATP-dependent protease
MPYQNEADVEEIPEDVRKEIQFIPATRISDVLAAALEAEPSEIPPMYVPAPAEAPSDHADRLIAKEKDS